MSKTLAAALLAGALAAPALAAPPVASPFQPGMWTYATTIDNVQIAGGMAGMGAVLRGKTTTFTHCLTPADAKKGAAEAINANKSCSYLKQSIAGGHISVEARCQRGATTEQLAEDGSYTPTGFRIKARAVQSGGSMPMTMDMTLVGTRTGSCGG